MILVVGTRELEWGSMIGEMRDSTALLDDPAALRERLAADGYLRLRGVQDRKAVLDARRQILTYLRERGGEIRQGTPLMNGSINPGAPSVPLMGQRAITHTPEVLAVLESRRIFDFFERLLEEPALSFDYKWLRQVGTGGYTGCHVDNVYMGRGSSRLLTCWTPFGDIDMAQGTLAICEGSHRLPGFARVRETYGRSDVDRDLYGGWFTTDPLEIVRKFGGRWVTANFSAGDVVILTMLVMHGSTTNRTDRWRLSCDTRFQPASEPADERWVGNASMGHTGKDAQRLRSMNEVRRDWGV